MLPDDWLPQLRKLYPPRDGGQGWYKLQRLIPAAMARGATWERIVEGTRRYRIWCGRKGITRTEYCMQAATFYGRDMHFEEWADYDLRSPAEIAADAERIELSERAVALGFRDIDWSRGIPTVRRAIEIAEQQAQAGAGIVVPDKRLRVVK